MKPVCSGSILIRTFKHNSKSQNRVLKQRTWQGDVDGEEAVRREVLYGVRDALLAQHPCDVSVQRAHTHLHTQRCMRVLHKSCGTLQQSQ